MPQPGEIYDRLDTGPSSPPLRVVVVSHDLYNRGTGMAFACPVYPDDGVVSADQPVFVHCSVGGAKSLIIPDNVYRIPVSGLAGVPVGRLPDDALDRIRSILRGIFA